MGLVERDGRRPIYKETFERGEGRRRPVLLGFDPGVETPSFRSPRTSAGPSIISGRVPMSIRIGWCTSASVGYAMLSSVMLVVEPRFKAAVLIAGGFRHFPLDARGRAVPVRTARAYRSS